jgi:putative phosphoribosyl transferase
MFFRDRTDAGRRLAMRLRTHGCGSDALVLGLPRGGVVVAFEIAMALHAPLDVFVVRKLGVPGREELAMGAIAPGNVVVRNESVIDDVNISENAFQAALQRQRAVLTQREATYRGHRPPPAIHDHSVILVDDGLATGASMQAAIEAARAQRPERLMVAVPVAARGTCEMLRPAVDDLVCLTTPEPFLAVSQWYEDFRQTTDEEVRRLLEEADQRLMATSQV